MESKNTKNRNLELLKEIFELYKNSDLKISEKSGISFVADEINKKVDRIERECREKMSVSEECLNRIYNYKRKKS
jgi:hypothetical protein